jgi:hypothetical protein
MTSAEKKRLLRRFAPRNYNEEDRELEGVSNVMELYIRFIFALSFAIIFLYAQRGNR